MADGGIDAAAIRTAVDIFYERLLADPVFSDVFEGVDMRRLRSHQRAFLLQALGGLTLYSGHNIQIAHAGLGISDRQFTRAREHLMASLHEAGVAADVVDRATADIERLRPMIVAR